MLSLDTEDRNKYLALQQTNEIKPSENKRTTETKLIIRVRKILKSQISAKTKMIAIFFHTAGILAWSKTDLERLDKHIRTSLTEYGMLHPNSTIETLLNSQSERRRKNHKRFSLNILTCTTIGSEPTSGTHNS